MSSWKKAAKTSQKTHRERHQPESRQHLGILEKKKDYVARARNVQENQETIKLLRKRALNKNPDEFYFHMINSKTKNGVHRERGKVGKHTPEQIQLMETQDLKYIAYKRNIESKRVEKLQSQLHLIDAANVAPNQHTFFLENNEEMQDFDLAEKLDTHPALISRRSNRPKLSSLKDIKIPYLTIEDLRRIRKEKMQSYKELQKRVDREKQLTIVQQKLEMERALKDKKVTKPKMLKKATKECPPIYKWKYERKR